MKAKHSTIDNPLYARIVLWWQREKVRLSHSLATNHDLEAEARQAVQAHKIWQVAKGDMHMMVFFEERDGLQPRSNGLQPRSDGLQLNRDGLPTY